MYELALFSGAGGGILGGMLCGHTCIGACEIEEYPRKVLLARQRDGVLPRFPVFGDIREFRSDNPECSEYFDFLRSIKDELVISGGFPCTNISAANNGRGGGIHGEESGLWVEMLRIICEVRPAEAFMENSPIITSRGLGVVLADLAKNGYDCRWDCFDGYEVGAPCKRERWFALAEDTRTNKKFGKHTKPNLLNKTTVKNNIWCVDKFTALLERDQKQMPIISGDERIVNGVPHTVDRFAAVGNAQIPAVVKLAWDCLH